MNIENRIRHIDEELLIVKKQVKERLKIPKNETYVLKLAEHLDDDQRALFYQTVIQHTRGNWPSVTIIESNNNLKTFGSIRKQCSEDSVIDCINILSHNGKSSFSKSDFIDRLSNTKYFDTKTANREFEELIRVGRILITRYDLYERVWNESK